jgi:hypothetical protein
MKVFLITKEIKDNIILKKFNKTKEIEFQMVTEEALEGKAFISDLCNQYQMS